MDDLESIRSTSLQTFYSLMQEYQHLSLPTKSFWISTTRSIILEAGLYFSITLSTEEIILSLLKKLGKTLPSSTKIASFLRQFLRLKGLIHSRMAFGNSQYSTIDGCCFLIINDQMENIHEALTGLF